MRAGKTGKYMRNVVVAGARPNFEKVSPLRAGLKARRGIDTYFVHAGQHYDSQMSELFFEQSKIPQPDIDLEVGSTSHAVQTAEIMKAFEPVLLKRKPDAVIFVGDVNNTIA